MKNRIKSLPLILMTSLLIACSPLPNETDEENSEEVEGTQNNSSVVSRNYLGDEYYRPVLGAEGQYQPSQNRGITSNLNSGINISLFEKDLMRLSQDYFSTEEYFIQEGQFLTREVVNSWLGRESEENPEGLNRPNSGDPENRVPLYLNSILEFDFYQETESGLNFSGITIGLAMNSVEYYQLESDPFGPTYEQAISPEKVLEEGQRMANMIVARLRAVEGFENIPIMIGIYEQSEKDDLGGGVFVATGISEDGATAIQSWEAVNEERLIFPLEGANSAEGNAFANFRSEVESFFPNLSGVTGRAHYVDEQLVSLHIDIMTQFYGQTEMIAFTQYLKQSATTFLPSDLDVEIVVESPDTVRAFLKRDRTDTEYFSYVFD